MLMRRDDLGMAKKIELGISALGISGSDTRMPRATEEMPGLDRAFVTHMMQAIP